MKSAILAGLALLSGSTMALAEDPTGTWMLSSGKVTVRVEKCGSELCGKIVGLKKPLDKHGNPKLDKENPDPSLRSRPVMGLSLLQNVKPDGEGQWKGAIYNPDDGRTYSAVLSLDGDVMKVKGCVVVFCKTNKFVRIE